MQLKQALLHNTGWKMFTMLFTFLSNILIVRILGVEASANFFYAFAVFILLSTVLKFGLENGIIYFLSKKSADTGAVVVLLLMVLFFQVIVTTILLKFIVRGITDFTMFWAVLFVTANIILYYVNALYQVKKMYISLNITSAAVTFLQTVLLIYLYFSPNNFLVELKLARNQIDSMLLISGVAILIQISLLIVFYYLQNKKDFIKMQWDIAVTKNIFAYSSVNFVITVLFFLVMRADLYFVEKYCSKISLSNYLQAAKIGQLLLIFPGLLAGVIFPFTIDNPKSLAGKVAYLCRTLTFLYLIVYVVFLLTGNFVFTWLLGSDFKLMYEIFAVSFFGVYCLSINLLIISYFEGINKQVIIIKAFLITLFILITANYVLVPIYNYIAAAAIFSVANCLGTLILLKAFFKETGINLNDTFLITPTDLKIFTINKK